MLGAEPGAAGVRALLRDRSGAAGVWEEDGGVDAAAGGKGGEEGGGVCGEVDGDVGGA